MFKGLRKRATYANVAATFALVFAMTGGAYAASKYLITSTKQIKPSVLAQLKGKNGAKGAPGAQGPQGAPGEKGAAGTNATNGTNGEKGAVGATGPAGPTGASGTTGKQGLAGEPWAANSTLPKGDSLVGPGHEPGAQETGVWAYVPAAAEKKEDVPISFVVKLASPIPFESEKLERVAYIAAKEAEGAEEEARAIEEHHCAGNAAKPEAAAGYLCIFEAYEHLEGTTEQVNHYGAFPPLTFVRSEKEQGAATTGAVLVFKVAKREGIQELTGTWAVGGD